MNLLQDINPFNSIKSALKSASRETGVDFDYLMKTAQRESSLDPKAKARTSSATGLFQFIEQTWLGVLKTDGADLGLGDLAANIKQGNDGRFHVADKKLRKQILDLRKDPHVSAKMAGALTRQNNEILSRGLNRSPNEAELYMAHFMGGEGALRFIQLAQNKPDATAASYFPNEARANKSIFYAGKGKPRSMADVYQVLAAKHGSAPVEVSKGLVASRSHSNQLEAQQAVKPVAQEPQPFTASTDSNAPVFHAMFGPNTVMTTAKGEQDLLSLWAQTRRSNPQAVVERQEPVLQPLNTESKAAKTIAALEAAPVPPTRPMMAETPERLNGLLARGASLFGLFSLASADSLGASNPSVPKPESKSRQDGAIARTLASNASQRSNNDGAIGAPIDLAALTAGAWERKI